MFTTGQAMNVLANLVTLLPGNQVHGETHKIQDFRFFSSFLQLTCTYSDKDTVCPRITTLNDITIAVDSVAAAAAAQNRRTLEITHF
jgi:hypothetical protein